METLQSKIIGYIGRRFWEKMELPSFLIDSLNPSKPLRPYQDECFKLLLSYFETYDEREFNVNLLFHMATGSGKTLIMAGAILYLYQRGYRNFLFLVHLDNIISKTKENFLNKASQKYLFAPSINIDNYEVEVNEVRNFDESRSDCINICFSSIQKLHSDFSAPKENSLSFESFSERGVVIISDEAHHLNAETKKGKKLTEEDAIDIHTWEGVVTKIFKIQNEENMGNVLLEFTATEDLKDKNIASKYENKIIFDYPLKKFRQDRYSKEITVVQTEADHKIMALQAMILSQYKKHLFASIGVDAKPIVLFKSKTKKDNKKFYSCIEELLESANSNNINSIYTNASKHLKQALDFFNKKDDSFSSLLIELRQDFNESHSLIVDTDNKLGEDEKRLLNTLEDKSNSIRAIYAVDMLNEGWDVLNLFDIVRLYDTRDGNYTKDGYVVGKTTMQEAQLIGRGARFYPYKDNVSGIVIDRRMYDLNIDNPLRNIETVHYHSRKDPDYIRELKVALVRTGAIDPEYKIIEERLKKDFKETNLYKSGYVFTNEVEKRPVFNNIQSIPLLSHHLKVKLNSGKMNQSEIMSDNDDFSSGLESKYQTIELGQLGENILRTALNKFEAFKFSRLKEYFPKLTSIQEFIKGESYLYNVKVDVSNIDTILNQRNKLFIAINALRQLEPIVTKEGVKKSGSFEFKPKAFKSVFKDHILKISVDDNSDGQKGKSMQYSQNEEFRMDVMNAKWHAYEDCFGTSEEKYLVKYIESIYSNLKNKYEDIFLVRNECDLKLYSFDDGNVFEPDYVLFLKRKLENERYDSIQIFIEPKGEHLRKTDKWKQDFLLEIKKKAKVFFSTQSSDFNVWGVPFYTESLKKEFVSAFETSVINE